MNLKLKKKDKMNKKSKQLNEEFAKKVIAQMKEKYAGMGLEMGYTDEEMMAIMMPNINASRPESVPSGNVDIVME